MSDQYWNYTTLLCHMEGSDGSTTITDEAGHTGTAAGNAQIDTAQFAVGSSSLLCDGTGDVVTFPDSTDWDFGSGDFTIEAWVRPANTSQSCDIVSKRLTGATFGPFLLYQGTTAFNLFMSSNGTSWDMVGGTSFGTATANTWTHLAAARVGTTIRLFRNGVYVTSVTSGATPIDNSVDLAIGGSADGSSSFNGWVDEVRITKGIGRYGSSFTVPTTPYSSDSGRVVAESVPSVRGTAGKRQMSDAFNTFFGVEDTTIDPVPKVAGSLQLFAPLHGTSARILNPKDVVRIGLHGPRQLTGGQDSSRTVQGTVTELGLPVSRIVRVYRADNGKLIVSTTSDLLGKFHARWAGYTGAVDVVAFDDAAGVSYSASIKANVTPA